MPTTSNFGWTTPADTDLVKDGAAAIRTLGNGIDTSFLDLKGGTTGQVLSKASNTDLDFTWTADASGIPATIFDAKGDLIAASAADTAARLAVGSNDQVLTADSSTATGLKWATPSSGSMTLLSTTTLSGSSTVISSIPTTYQDLRLVIRDFYPATDAATMSLRWNADTAANYTTGAWQGGGGPTTFAQTSHPLASEGMDNSVRENLAIIDVFDYANTDTWKISFLTALYVNPTTTTSGNYTQNTGYYRSTSAITSITLFTSTGNFSGGTAYLYGVK